MNERYLFRGKRTDNGKWEIGLLARYNEKYPCANIIDETELLIPVHTKTVGQCTGLKDKNGKLIFEGDIVVSTSDRRLSDRPRLITIDFERGCNYCAARRKPVVIGNIHDNPNLLKLEHDSLCEIETYKAGDEE